MKTSDTCEMLMYEPPKPGVRPSVSLCGAKGATRVGTQLLCEVHRKAIAATPVLKRKADRLIWPEYPRGKDK